MIGFRALIRVEVQSWADGLGVVFILGAAVCFLQRGRNPAEAAAGVRVGADKTPKVSATRGGGTGQCSAAEGDHCGAGKAKVRSRGLAWHVREEERVGSGEVAGQRQVFRVLGLQGTAQYCGLEG